MLPQLHVAIYILVHPYSNGQSVQPKFMPTATEVSFIVMTKVLKLQYSCPVGQGITYDTTGTSCG